MRAVTVAETEEALAPHLGDWTALAVERAAPSCLPAWMLAWWRHAAPPNARLRVVLVHEDSDLVGVAPYFAHRGYRGRDDHRLLTSGVCHRIGPLARAGTEAAVAGAVAGALAAGRPALVSFEGIDARSPWPELVRAAWPGRLRPHRYRMSELASPVVTLGAGSFDEWLAARSQNFRGQMRSSRRRLERAGGRLSLAAGAEEAARAAAAFADLHHGRWSERGGSGFDHAVTRDMLADAARTMPAGALRLFVLELDGRPACVQVFLAAGGEVHYWNGGWDEAAAPLRPAQLCILAGIEDSIGRGERRLDLGGGDSHYKRRFADPSATEAVRWTGLVPVGRGYPAARGRMLAGQARRAARRAAERLPASAQERLRRLVRR